MSAPQGRGRGAARPGRKPFQPVKETSKSTSKRKAPALSSDQPSVSRGRVDRATPKRQVNADLKSLRESRPSVLLSMPLSQLPSWRNPEQADKADYNRRMSDLFQQAKLDREQERKHAIHQGLLADPEKPTSLAEAITPVGTCQEMCPAFERIERIVQNMADACEKVTIQSSDRRVPIEALMVKRFKRSAAGTDDQIPSDIRPSHVLLKTLDYLLDEIVGGPQPLAVVHKFVWDRTRAIRNDFSIQQVTRLEDLKIAIQCFECIARFHIVSLHQLSDPTKDSGGFDAHQEREQLNNTLLSLIYYYDDSRSRYKSPHEAEFRAYCIIFEIQERRPDLEDRAQTWPKDILKHPRVQLALKLYAAAGNTTDYQGPLRPFTTYPIAQNFYGRFWSTLASKQVPYLMACVTEMYFNHVRGKALDTVWRAFKGPRANKSEDIVLAYVTEALGFDNQEQTQTYCEEHGFKIGEREDGEAFLELNSITAIKDTNHTRPQGFSRTYVESKRFRRPLPALMRGWSVARCKASKLLEPSSTAAPTDDDHIFVSDDGNTTSMSMLKRDAADTTPAPKHLAATSTEPNPFAKNVFSMNPLEKPTPPESPWPLSSVSVLEPPTLFNPFASSAGFSTSSSGIVSAFATSSPFSSAPTSTEASNLFGTTSNTRNQNPFKITSLLGDAGEQHAGASTVPSSTGIPDIQSQSQQSLFPAFNLPNSNPATATKSSTIVSEVGAQNLPARNSVTPEKPTLPTHSTQIHQTLSTNSILSQAVSEQRPQVDFLSSSTIEQKGLPSQEPSRSTPNQPASLDEATLEFFRRTSSQLKGSLDNNTISSYNSPDDGINQSSSLLSSKDDIPISLSGAHTTQELGFGTAISASLEEPKDIGRTPSEVSKDARNAAFVAFIANSKSTSHAPSADLSPSASDQSMQYIEPATNWPTFSRHGNNQGRQDTSSYPPTNRKYLCSPATGSGSTREESKALVSEPLSVQSKPVLPMSERLDGFAREVVLGPEGILEQFTEHILQSIVTKEIKKERRRQDINKAKQARDYVLALWYGRRWRRRAYEMALARKGKERRKILPKALRDLHQSFSGKAQTSKDSVGEYLVHLDKRVAEPKETLPKKTMQSKLTQMSSCDNNSSPQKSTLFPVVPDSTDLQRNNLPIPSRVSGQFQKYNPRRTTRYPHAESHMAEPVRRIQTSLAYQHHSHRLDPDGSRLKRFHELASNPATAQSDECMRLAKTLNGMYRPKNDNTQTDYFRLKAMRVDPNTSLIPHHREQTSFPDTLGDGSSLSSRFNVPGFLPGSQTFTEGTVAPRLAKYPGSEDVAAMNRPTPEVLTHGPSASLPSTIPMISAPSDNISEPTVNNVVKYRERDDGFEDLMRQTRELTKHMAEETRKMREERLQWEKGRSLSGSSRMDLAELGTSAPKSSSEVVEPSMSDNRSNSSLLDIHGNEDITNNPSRTTLRLQKTNGKNIYEFLARDREERSKRKRDKDDEAVKVLNEEQARTHGPAKKIMKMGVSEASSWTDIHALADSDRFVPFEQSEKQYSLKDETTNVDLHKGASAENAIEL